MEQLEETNAQESPAVKGESATFSRASATRPFIKWAGGKGKLLSELVSRVPENFNTYFEPFLGGGALFFELQPEKAVLADFNAELINAYKVVQRDVEKLIDELSRHRHNKRHFYRVRDFDRSPAFWVFSDVERAARFIYLNKTCFNGLYRVNSRGEFNVPFGDYKNPAILDAENLRACSAALQGRELVRRSFEEVVGATSKGDFVYYDPPYMPVSKTANFTAYGKEGFTAEDHTRLRDTCIELDKKGVKFMLSNSDAPLVLELYRDFNLETVQSSRSINSKATLRGPVKEVIVRNY